MRRTPHEGLEVKSLEAEGSQLAAATGTLPQPQETMRKDAALKECVELVLDELRQVGGDFGLG